MKKLYFRFVTLLIVPVWLWSCSQDPPLISLGLDDTYSIPRMKPYRLQPAYTGQSYRWTLKTGLGTDSLLSTDHSYTFLQAREGTYHLTFEIIDPENPCVHELRFEVLHEEVEYSPYLARVYEYRPAPGQFVNKLPPYEKGDTEADMCKKAKEYLSETTRQEVSLGGYGGYITFGFDHTVVNVPGEKDFMIFGNAIYEKIGDVVTGSSSEPGIVQVAFDRNGNGIPDPEEWYELAGSEHGKPSTLCNYEITYYRPDPDKPLVPGAGVIDAEYISWTDNQGGAGFITRNGTHLQDYYPQWLTEDQLVFSGTLLPPNGVYQPGGFILYPYEWGYADNHPNSKQGLISFDIDWAVDQEGNPVHLPGVDFIRVYTGLNQSLGMLGETSTEITGAQDLHVKGYE